MFPTNALTAKLAQDVGLEVSAQSMAQLSQPGNQMAVISNSDGRVETIRREAGLYEDFDIVIDSHLVGGGKPERKISDWPGARLPSLKHLPDG